MTAKPSIELIKHKTFQKALDEGNQPITYGNVCSDTCFGNYIPAENQLECNGFAFKKGELRKRALSYFKGIPAFVQIELDNRKNEEGICLYKIRHYNRGQEVVHGWLVSNKEKVVYHTWGNTIKVDSILDYATKKINHDLSKVKRK